MPDPDTHSEGRELAEPEWFREPTPREHRIAAGLFIGFGLFFIALFFVQVHWWFRWVILCVGGLGFIGYLAVTSQLLYGEMGPTFANVMVGVASAVIDNIPIMAGVIQMTPQMSDGQWLLITLTAGVGGSMLSIGSAAGVALMGQARGHYTFFSHLRWTPVIALGYAASIATHLWVNSRLF